MNREWNLGSAGKVTEMMDEYRAIGQILNRGFRNINDEKAEKILQILFKALKEIESTIRE